MADKVSIAIRQEQAFNRLSEGMAAFAVRYGIDAPEIPKQGRDVELLRAQQFEVLADWFERALKAPERRAVPAESTDYEALSKADLVLMAKDRNIEVGSKSTKSELVDLLLAADQAPSPQPDEE